MAFNTTFRGYPVPESDDPVQVYTHMQNALESVDGDVQTIVDTQLTATTDATIGSAASGFTTSSASSHTLLDGQLVQISVAVVNTSALTATSGGITDVLCFTLDSPYRPDVEINAAFGTGSVTGEMVINTDGTCVLRSASDTVASSSAIRFFAAFIKAS